VRLGHSSRRGDHGGAGEECGKGDVEIRRKEIGGRRKETYMNSAPARSFEDLIVWQKAHALVLGVYRATRTFPREEVYGLTAQLRRAAASIPANIAEGFKKRGRSDKARFMNVAEGSLEETRYYLRLALDLGYLWSEPPLSQQALEVGRLLGAYSRRLLSPSS
jgi:four helix bundle protein